MNLITGFLHWRHCWWHQCILLCFVNERANWSQRGCALRCCSEPKLAAQPAVMFFKILCRRLLIWSSCISQTLGPFETSFMIWCDATPLFMLLRPFTRNTFGWHSNVTVRAATTELQWPGLNLNLQCCLSGDCTSTLWTPAFPLCAPFYSIIQKICGLVSSLATVNQWGWICTTMYDHGLYDHETAWLSIMNMTWIQETQGMLKCSFVLYSCNVVRDVINHWFNKSWYITWWTWSRISVDIYCKPQRSW